MYIKVTDNIGMGSLRVFNYVEELVQPAQGQSNYGYYERDGNSGNNSNYAMYNDGGYYTNNRMTMDNMDNRPPHMSNPAPSMR